MVVVCLVGWVGGTLLAGRKSHQGKTWRQKVKCKANVQHCLQGLTGRVFLYPSDTHYLFVYKGKIPSKLSHTACLTSMVPLISFCHLFEAYKTNRQ